MVKSVDPDTLKLVLDTWGKLKETEDYENLAGQKVMKLYVDEIHYRKRRKLWRQGVGQGLIVRKITTRTHAVHTRLLLYCSLLLM